MSLMICQRFLPCNKRIYTHVIDSTCCYSFRRPDTPAPEFRKHKKLRRRSNPKGLTEQEAFPTEFSVDYPPKGKSYDNKPFKAMLEAGKKYAWCSCGFSKAQPFCDGHHKLLAEKTFLKSKPIMEPIRFSVDETKEYFLCNCKQTENRPFCDGTHRREDIMTKFKA